MAELTNTGLTVDRFTDIKEILIENIQALASGQFSFAEGEILTHMIDVLATEMAKYEEVLQLLYASLDRDKAEGERLDALLFLVGLERLSASKTSGDVTIVTGEGSSIPVGTVLQNPSSGNRYFTTLTTLSTVENCVEAHYEVSQVNDSTLYTVTIDGVDYNYTSPASGTTDEIIVDSLVSIIEADTLATYTASKSLDPVRLVVTSDTDDYIKVSVEQYFTPFSAQVRVPVEAEVAGSIKAPSFSITEAVTPISSLIGVYNEEPLGLGRKRETDAEFRARAQRSLAVSGSSTYSAMLAAMLNLDFVSNVLIEENETNTTNALNLPPHSFEVIVTAPDTEANNQVIGTTIWEEKPLGIQTYGNTSVTISDSNGMPRLIKFSRPSEVIIAVRVTYITYEEEPQTELINTAIRNSIVETGQLLSSGGDVIPSRFIGNIYQNTSGLGKVTVEAQTLSSTGDIPVELDWSEDKISISPSEFASFVAGDVYIVDGTP